MKLVKTENGSIGVALFADSTEVTITERGYVAVDSQGSKQQSIAHKATSLVVEAGVTEPAKFVPLAQSHIEGHWSIVDQERYDYDPAAEALARAKATKQAQIDADYEAAVNQLFAGYSPSQRDSFAKQEEQARSFIANPDETRTDLPMLKALAVARASESLSPMADQAARIIAKADAAEPVFGTILGTKQAREDALALATTLQQVEAA